MVAAKAKAIGLDTLVQNISIGYVIIFIVVLTLVLLKSKTLKAKIVGGIALTFLFAIAPYWLLIHKSPAQKQQEIEQAEYVAKYEVAKPIFDKLCAEQSKPIIKRTVEDVEGVLLLKVRPKSDHIEWANSLWAGAALVGEDSGEDYIRSFLIDRRQRPNTTSSVTPNLEVVYELNGEPQPEYASERGGNMQRSFRYVVTPDSENSWIRVTASVDSGSLQAREKIKLNRTPFKGKLPMYGVTFDDNLDPELRKHWIAGTTVKITETKTNEVIAEQSFWRWDKGFGSTAGFRSPWPGAWDRCPAARPGGSDKQTTLFVDEVLKAKQGN